MYWATRDSKSRPGDLRRESATPTEAAFYRLKRAKYLLCNIYDATLKIIAVAKVKANIVIHICSSIASQAGARPISQPPAPALTLSRWTGPQPMIRATSEPFVRHGQWLASVGARGPS